MKLELRKTILAFDIFEKWIIDAIGPLPITSQGKSYILTVVDYLSRWVKTRAPRQITAKEATRFVYKDIYCKIGASLELLLIKGLVLRLICWITCARR